NRLPTKRRVCSSSTRCAPVNRGLPLAILKRCDDPKMKLNEDARTALKLLERFRSCDRAKLHARARGADSHLRVNY
ncbi:hypothetical protein PENTCL1PPCAC_8034, partial [Pristionchus entomophagus]